jgi:hypothetical protein
MITKNDTILERKVPILGDVPIIGNAFRYDLKTLNRTELLFFLTPRIIHDDETSEMIKQIEAERMTFMESEAERMHGPLYGIPPREPMQALPTTDTEDTSPASPSDTPKTRRNPKPPDPGISPTAHRTREPQPVPAFDDDAANGVPSLPNDDDEDLDAAFIQTNYQSPAGGNPDAGRARVTKAAGKAAATTKKKTAPANSAKSTLKPAKVQSQKSRPTDPDD